MSLRGGQSPTWQSVLRNISLPCEREVARAQPVTEGFRPQESCPENGIPQSSLRDASPLSQGGQTLQSASLTAPLSGEPKTEDADCRVGPSDLLAMTVNRFRVEPTAFRFLSLRGAQRRGNPFPTSPPPLFPISRSECGKLLALYLSVIFSDIITNYFTHLQPLTLSQTLS